MALKRLIFVSASEDVAAFVEPSILDAPEPGCVFEVTKSETTFDSELVVHVLIDEEISERLVQRH